MQTLISEQSDVEEEENFPTRVNRRLEHSRRSRVWCTGNSMDVFEDLFVNGYQCLLCPIEMS